jgi:uncharacterized protein (DUF1697 family)
LARVSTYIAFLRAVNVGGRTVPMAALRGHLAQAGFTDVATYIQSGNVRVGSALRSATKVEAQLEKVMSAAFGFDIPAIVRRPEELVEMVDTSPANPLGEGARHYVSFLRDQPTAGQVDELNTWDVDGERMIVVGRDVHLWFEKPTHLAKLTNARIEKLAGTQSTNRNWTVVTALAKKWC